MALFRLVRLPNLIIVLLTQYLLFYRLLRPAMLSSGIQPVLDDLNFALFALVTTGITAWGYVVNDLLDPKTDLIHRPEKVILERKHSFQTAYWIAGALFLLCFFASFYLAFSLGRLPLLGIYPAAIMGLFAYNAYFKRKFLTGNFLIALYCAGAAAVLWLAELPALSELGVKAPVTALKVRSIFLWFTAFAFLITMFREIIKDIEDVKGDRIAGCRTAPVVVGENGARQLATFFGLLLLLFLVLHGYYYHPQFGNAVMVYLTVAVALPLVVALIALQGAGNERAYHRISQLVKMIMLSGILLLLFIKF